MTAPAPVPIPPGTVTTGLTVNEDGCSADSLTYCGAVTATVGADESWDWFVATAIEREWVGLEALSGWSGTVGEAAAANVQAFGQSVADTLSGVHTWDRQTGSRRYLAVADCRFRPGGSRLSRERITDGPLRYAPLQVSFLLPQGDITAPIRDESLTDLLGVEPGSRVPLSRVRAAVLSERSGPTDRFGRDRS